MKKYFLFFAFIAVYSSYAQTYLQLDINPPSTGTIINVVPANEGVYIQDVSKKHYVVKVGLEELISDSAEIILGSFMLGNTDKQTYIEKRNTGPNYIMADSVEARACLLPNTNDILDMYRDSTVGRTHVAVARQTSAVGPAINVYVFDDNFNNGGSITFPQTIAGYKDVVITDKDNAVASDEFGNIHQQCTYWATGLSSQDYSFNFSNLIDLAVDNNNNLILVSEVEGITYTQPVPVPGSNDIQYVVASQHYPNFPIGDHIKMEFKDRNCDGDMDVITYNILTGEFAAHESLFSQTGVHEYDTQILGFFPDGVINWVHYNGPSDGWDPAIASRDIISIFQDKDGGCNATTGINFISMGEYEGRVSVRDQKGREVYTGTKLPNYDKYANQHGWAPGMYFVYALESTKVKVQQIPIFH